MSPGTGDGVEGTHPCRVPGSAVDEQCDAEDNDDEKVHEAPSVSH
jgi:hypothetical protein